MALPVLPEAWAYFWRADQWNELRARIVGNPPLITTWINGVKIMEWTEKEVRHPDTGGIALQVHGGGDHTKEFVRYRNVKVKKLAPETAAAEPEASVVPGASLCTPEAVGVEGSGKIGAEAVER